MQVSTRRPHGSRSGSRSSPSCRPNRDTSDQALPLRRRDARGQDRPVAPMASLLEIGEAPLISKNCSGMPKRLRPTPQPLSTQLVATAGAALDRSPGMLRERLSHRGADREPVAHDFHVAKRYAGLRNAEVAGVHADDKRLRPGPAIAL